MLSYTVDVEALRAEVIGFEWDTIIGQIMRYSPQAIGTAMAVRNDERALAAIDELRVFINELERRLVGGCSVCEEPGDIARLDSAGRCMKCQT